MRGHNPVIAPCSIIIETGTLRFREAHEVIGQNFVQRDTDGQVTGAGLLGCHEDVVL